MKQRAPEHGRPFLCLLTRTNVRVTLDVHPSGSLQISPSSDQTVGSPSFGATRRPSGRPDVGRECRKLTTSHRRNGVSGGANRKRTECALSTYLSPGRHSFPTLDVVFFQTAPGIRINRLRMLREELGLA